MTNSKRAKGITSHNVTDYPPSILIIGTFGLVWQTWLEKFGWTQKNRCSPGRQRHFNINLQLTVDPYEDALLLNTLRRLNIIECHLAVQLAEKELCLLFQPVGVIEVRRLRQLLEAGQSKAVKERFGRSVKDWTAYSLGTPDLMNEILIIQRMNRPFRLYPRISSISTRVIGWR